VPHAAAPARDRQIAAGAAAVEQAHAKLRLERLDAAAERRLADADGLGGAGKGLMIGKRRDMREERISMRQTHRKWPHSAIYELTMRRSSRASRSYPPTPKEPRNPMKALFPMMLGVTLLLLIIEIVAGRHRGIYRREDWSVIGLPALLNPLVSAPLAGFMVGSVAAFLFPRHAGTLSPPYPCLPAYLGILLLRKSSASTGSTASRIKA